MQPTQQWPKSATFIFYIKNDYIFYDSANQCFLLFTPFRKWNFPRNVVEIGSEIVDVEQAATHQRKYAHLNIRIILLVFNLFVSFFVATSFSRVIILRLLPNSPSIHKRWKDEKLPRKIRIKLFHKKVATNCIPQRKIKLTTKHYLPLKTCHRWIKAIAIVDEVILLQLWRVMQTQ